MFIKEDSNYPFYGHSLSGKVWIGILLVLSGCSNAQSVAAAKLAKLCSIEKLSRELLDLFIFVA